MFRYLLRTVFLSLLLASTSLMAVEVKPDHPKTYTVKQGDTLWGIAGQYLDNPGQWPEIWHANADIKNPDLIYPGDVLELVYVNGKPRLVRKAGGGKSKFTPQIRSTQSIPPIPLNLIEPFLDEIHVLDEESMRHPPHVIAFLDSDIIGGKGDRAYARDLMPTTATTFDIVRAGRVFTDADSGEKLGFVARHVGNASLVRGGEPATVQIHDTDLEVRRGDQLIAHRPIENPSYFIPRTPSTPVDGRVLAAYDTVTSVARNQVVLIDRGSADGLTQGDVLLIDNSGRTVRDQKAPELRPQVPPGDIGGIPQYSSSGPVYVTLPDERAGTLMVFRVYDRLSLALVMESARPIDIGDRVHNP